MTKNNSFIKGAAILGLAGVIVKILGALYRIPLANIIKDEGMGYYQTAHPFYVLLLTMSTSGFPIAIAKLVSERRAVGDYGGAHKVFKVALIGLTLGGLLSSLFILFYGEKIVVRINNVNAYYSLMALSPALFFVPIMAAFRGFFQGRQNMIPTALSQVVEQGTRLVSGLYLTYSLLDYGLAQAAGGASFGGSAGAALASVFIFAIYILERKKIKKEIRRGKALVYPTRAVVKDLLTIAIPITLGASILPIIDAIDASLVIKRLETINYSKSMANDLYGQLKGFAQTLVNLPQVFSLAIAASLVPAISQASTSGGKDQLENLANTGIRLTLLIGFPAALGLLALAGPIINLLYFNNSMETIASASRILSYLSIGVIFLTLVQTSTAILQGLGRPLAPVVNLLLGAGIKLILTYSLVAIEKINILGAGLSSIAAYCTGALLNLRVIKKEFKIGLNYKSIVIKPMLSSIVMAVLVRLAYSLLTLIMGQRTSTLLAIGLGGIIYLILLLVTGTITSEDMILLPKREKLSKIKIEE